MYVSSVMKEKIIYDQILAISGHFLLCPDIMSIHDLPLTMCTGLRTFIFMCILLTLSAHAREGYSSQFV